MWEILSKCYFAWMIKIINLLTFPLMARGGPEPNLCLTLTMGDSATFTSAFKFRPTWDRLSFLIISYVVQTLFLKTFWSVLLHPALVPLGEQTIKQPTNQRKSEIATMFNSRRWTWASFWAVNWLPTRVLSRNFSGWQQESIMLSRSRFSPLWQHLCHGTISLQLDRKGLHFPECTSTGQPLSHWSMSYWGFCRLLPYLYSLAKAFQGINIQPFLAGLQAGNHLLTLHFSRADGKTGQAAVEELSKPWFGDFSS